jgi:hypothetical protein
MLAAWCFNHRLTPSLYRDDPWERNCRKYEPRALTSSFYGQATEEDMMPFLLSIQAPELLVETTLNCREPSESNRAPEVFKAP